MGHHFCDAPPLTLLNIALCASPSPNDAHAHSLCHLLMGDHPFLPSNNHPCLLLSHLSIDGDALGACRHPRRFVSKIPECRCPSLLAMARPTSQHASRTPCSHSTGWASGRGSCCATSTGIHRSKTLASLFCICSFCISWPECIRLRVATQCRMADFLKECFLLQRVGFDSMSFP